MLSDDRLLDIFKALSDANRLRIYQLLLVSDRTNSELMGETLLSQNLLSHHLTVMVEAGLIEMHRSIGDARRHYYRPHLELPGKMVAWWQQHVPLAERPLPALQRPRRVLFLCQRNSARSLLAEALARALAAKALIVCSAGIEPGGTLSPLALRVLEERGIPTNGLDVKTFHDLGDQTFDFLVTVCDVVHETAIPDQYANCQHMHWSLPDPEMESDEAAGQLAITRRLYDQLEQRLAYFVGWLLRQEAAAASAATTETVERS